MSVAPPRPKGPHLNALRAFEAAARLGGFRMAAGELGVTPGAIAQHVKALEEWVGAALFERQSQGVVLTALGERTLPEFTRAFDQLGYAVQSLRSIATPTDIRIATLPSIAQLWLSSRLPAIRRAVPDLRISVTALEQMPNMDRDPFDLAIFYEDLPVAADHTVLATDDIFPVCAPELVNTMTSPDDLEQATCLYDTTWAGDWQKWYAHTRPGREFRPRGPGFSLYSLAVDEACNGAGILIGHRMLIEQHLASGRLVAPFGDLSVRIDRALTATPSRHPEARQTVDRVVAMLTHEKSR